MPVLDSDLFFNGNCAEAMRFYQRTLGGELEKLMTYGDSPEPEQCPAETFGMLTDRFGTSWMVGGGAQAA